MGWKKIVANFRPDMEKHSEFAKIQYFANLHKDSVLGIKYLPTNQTGEQKNQKMFQSQNC